MLDVPGPGIKPVSPALAGEFLTTGPPGRPQPLHFYSNHQEEGKRKRRKEEEKEERRLLLPSIAFIYKSWTQPAVMEARKCSFYSRQSCTSLIIEDSLLSKRGKWILAETTSSLYHRSSWDLNETLEGWAQSWTYSMHSLITIAITISSWGGGEYSGTMTRYFLILTSSFW